jgi:BirA family transcriptional regulator, biotin operon repressor / biotin---[acetyl-CoA-carboxylase] ligase
VERAPLDVQRLREALGSRWARVDVVDETESTNADLLSEADAADRTALAAEYQMAGRGRFERIWSSPPRAGLTFSVLLRPSVAIPHWGWLPLLAGVALHEAVGPVTGVAATLKWPNDLLAPDDRKLAGILAQTSGPAVVIGIGINVDTAAEELPVDTATSLALCGAEAVDRTELLIAILTRLDARYAQWTDCNGEAEACGLAAAYRAACSTLGRPVRVTLADGEVVSGDAIDLDEIGRLLVRTPDGTQPVGAGDVEHVRPS